MRRLTRALWNSIDGLAFAWRSEAAFRSEIWLLAAGLPAAIALGEDWQTRLLLFSSLIAILPIELLNTGIEKLCDHVRPEFHSQIKIVKDVSSAAILCASLAVGGVWLAALIGRLT